MTPDRFELGYDEHVRGDADCPACWSGYPRKHQCGGLMHAAFGEESWDGYSLVYRCDKCSDSDELEGMGA